MRSPILAAAVLAAALFSLPSAASAANFPATTEPGITSAILAADANPGPDVVTIAAGTYSISDTTFPSLAADSTNPISIVGAGVGQTILNGSTASNLISLQLPSASTSGISGFTLNANATGSFGRALVQYRGYVQDFAISQTGFGTGSNAAVEILGDSSSLTDGSISSVGNSRAVVGNGDGVKLRRLTLTGPGNGGWGVIVGGASSDWLVSRVKISGFNVGVMIQDGTMKLEDSVIDLGANNSVGIYTTDQNAAPPNSSIQFSAYRNTIVGTGTAPWGVYIATQEAGDTVNDTFKDNVFYFPNGGETYLCSGAGLTVTAEGTAHASTLASGCSTGTFSDSVALTGSPFVDFAARDLRPAVGSQLIDVGVAGGQAGSTDLAGATRIVDGNGDGNPVIDIGAFEYQLPVPPTGGGGGSGDQIPITTPLPAAATAKLAAKPKKAFKIGKKGIAAAKKSAASFSVKFTDSAKARFTLQSIGRKKKLKSLKGSQSLTVTTGTMKLSFGGTWNKKKLKPGEYRVTVTPLSATGAAGKPVTVDLKLEQAK